MESTSLFGELLPQTQPQFPPSPEPGPFAGVAIEQSVDRMLDYAIPPAFVNQLQVGMRVRVPLGRNNRGTFGYVISIHPTTSYPRIKRLMSIEDDRVLIPPRLMELSRWISRYYCAPLGAVLEAVLPSAVRKKVGLGYTHVVRLAVSREKIQETLEKARTAKRRSILARLLQIEPDGSVDLVRLAGDSGASPPTIRKLARLGLITITQEVDLPSFTASMPESAANQAAIALNEDQQKVFDTMLPKVTGGGFSVNLLLGVTGSGKTEVYLQCIAEVVKRGLQAIVLVPEIALTPQTVRRFTARFSSVAILHSGLTATERHRYWQQISAGQAQVIVGARSAVFAPAKKLGIIVVDEEHEASYKQDSSPRYHGRDVAIKRGQIEDVPVLLGSATPSLETYYRVLTREKAQAASVGSAHSLSPVLRGEGWGEGQSAKPGDTRSSAKSPLPSSTLRPAPQPSPLSTGEREPESSGEKEQNREPQSQYSLLSLPRRVRGLQMPHVELIDLKQEGKFRRGVHLLSQRLEHLLRTTVESGHQAILLLNRRGYSNFVYCASCQEAVKCKYCDATMTYHRSAGADAANATTAQSLHTGQLHCHYCLAVNALPDKCPSCGKLLSLFGLGTQRVEEEIRRKFPELKFARVDSDSMRGLKDYENLLGSFAKGDIQVMLGTQMIAKGLDYPNVTLVGVISGDTALALPDFRASERTFQLITQVAGRAGRGDSPGRVVLQTFLPDDATIQAAIKQDYVGFARMELANRRDVGYPPFGRMVRIVLRDQDQDKLHKYAADLHGALAKVIAEHALPIKMKGPMPCAINRISGYHRGQLLLNADTAAPLQKALLTVRQAGALSKTDRIAVDVDPVSLL